MNAPGSAGYADAAERLLATRLDFDAVHAPYLHLLPDAPARILDVGAGPGHDAALFAGRGHQVVAVEPTPALREGARRLFPDAPVRWVDDALPDLTSVRDLGLRFDLVLLSGVWFHLDPRERTRGMPVLAGLLEPGGLLALSLRHGPVPSGRRGFPVTADETITLAGAWGLECAVRVERGSLQEGNRAAGVTWTILGFQAEGQAR